MSDRLQIFGAPVRQKTSHDDFKFLPLQHAVLSLLPSAAQIMMINLLIIKLGSKRHFKILSFDVHKANLILLKGRHSQINIMNREVVMRTHFLCGRIVAAQRKAFSLGHVLLATIVHPLFLARVIASSGQSDKSQKNYGFDHHFITIISKYKKLYPTKCVSRTPHCLPSRTSYGNTRVHSITFTSPPPGRCLALSNEPTLDSAFHSNLVHKEFTVMVMIMIIRYPSLYFKRSNKYWQSCLGHLAIILHIIRRSALSKLMDLLKYKDLLDEMVDEDWEQKDQDDRP
uniref:Uncharacterized protein n=1 Tax=Romanomermis culicivorax TaxID=13658 RepID=A0A915JSJ4_ROMCU